MGAVAAETEMTTPCSYPGLPPEGNYSVPQVLRTNSARYLKYLGTLRYSTYVVEKAREGE